MTFADLRHRLAQLPPAPDPETHLRPLAREMALLAGRTRYPAKSLAAFHRHSAAAGVATTLLDRLVWLTNEEIRSGGQTILPEAPSPSAAWLSVERAAHALQVSAQSLRKEWLRTVHGRRRLGWAWWDGQRWMIPEPAVNPVTRAEYMASLPVQEPAAHVAALPSWCEGASSV